MRFVKQAATEIGATDIQVLRDRPGNHDVWVTGQAGMFLKVGYRGSLRVSGDTGCRLPWARL